MTRFPDLTQDWFARYGGPIDPVDAAAAWAEWDDRQRPYDQRIRMALRIGSDLSESAVRFYVTGKNRHKLGQRARWILERLSRALGFEPEWRSMIGQQSAMPPHDARRVRELALVTELDVPSPSYHWEVIGSIVRRGSQRNVKVSIHPVEPQDLEAELNRLVANTDCDATILLRLSPNKACVELLSHGGVPAVLIHADRKKYARPVLANLVTSHETLRDELRKKITKHGADWVVVVSMDYESDQRSVRNERINTVLESLQGLRVEHVKIPDYSFRHAARVVEEHAHAGAYVALGDELGVAIRQLCAAAGKEGKLVVGFDGSWLARAEGLPSFDQELAEIGPVAIDLLCDRIRESGSGEWPPCEEIEMPVRLLDVEHPG